MMQYIDFADVRLRAADFGSNGPYGLSVNRIVVIKNQSDDPFWSAASSPSTAAHVLSKFSEVANSNGRWNHGDNCLLHLFTSQDFGGGTVGLAYIGAPNAASGTCNGYNTSAEEQEHYYNLGMTTDLNYGAKIPSLMHMLVTLHEIGHNFGAPHDSEDCPANVEDRYVMWPVSVDGGSSTHKSFSSCSEAAITKHMDSSSGCFVEKPIATCGNGKIDQAGADNKVGTGDDEECDSGRFDGDGCCDATCKLKATATCSDANSACCSGCQPTPNLTLCFKGVENDRKCQATAYCDGASVECPKGGQKSVGTACGSFGRCHAHTDPDLRCIGWCTNFGATMCTCSEVAQSCDICCRSDPNVDPFCAAGTGYDSARDTCLNASDGTNTPARRPFSQECTSANDLVRSSSEKEVVEFEESSFGFEGETRSAELRLLPGTKCDTGFCNTVGVCIKPKTGVEDGFVDAFENFTFSRFYAWMKKNVVAAAMIIAALAWLLLATVFQLRQWLNNRRTRRRGREPKNTGDDDADDAPMMLAEKELSYFDRHRSNQPTAASASPTSSSSSTATNRKWRRFKRNKIAVAPAPTGRGSVGRVDG
jgi:hypothetical protein